MSRQNRFRTLDTRYSLAAYAILCFVSLILYGNTIQNKFAIDDNGIVLENRFFIEGTSLHEIFTTNYRFGANAPGDGLYRPMAMFSYYLNYLTSGLDPVYFHLFNVILQTLSTVLLFILLKKLTNRFRLSFIAALLFAVHPIHTESVANIAGRPEILYTLFLFAAWLLLESGKKITIIYPFAAILLLFAVLSKETAVVFPFLVLTVDLLRNSIPRKKMIIKFGVLFTVVIIYLIVRWAVLGETTAGSIPRFYDNPLYSMDPFNRALNAFMVLGRYLLLLIFPYRLISDYSYKTLPLVSGAGILFSIMVAILFLSVVFVAVRYREKFPEYALGLAIFIFPYFLISNIVFPVGTIMGERLMYLSSAGIMLIIAGILDTGIVRARRATVSILAIVLIFYAGQTFMRNRDWYDDNSITAKDILKAPDNIKLIANMALIAKQKGNPLQAEQLYRKALSIYPDFAEGYSGLARLAYERSDLSVASDDYRMAADRAPYDVIIQFNYASVLIKQEYFDTANTVLKKAIERNPRAAILYRSMGNLCMSQERFQEAINYFEKALQLGDTKNICYNNLAATAYYGQNYELAWSYVKRASAENISLDQELVDSIQQQLKMR